MLSDPALCLFPPSLVHSQTHFYCVCLGKIVAAMFYCVCLGRIVAVVSSLGLCISLRVKSHHLLYNVSPALYFCSSSLVPGNHCLMQDTGHRLDGLGDAQTYFPSHCPTLTAANSGHLTVPNQAFPVHGQGYSPTHSRPLVLSHIGRLGC